MTGLQIQVKHHKGQKQTKTKRYETKKESLYDEHMLSVCALHIV